jgi:hypothetical protein
MAQSPGDQVHEIGSGIAVGLNDSTAAVQRALYAPFKARCSLTKASEYQTGHWWGEPRVALVPPSSFERPVCYAEPLARLQRASDGAYKGRCSRRIIQSDRNARPDFMNLVAGRLCHLHTSSEKKTTILPVHHVHELSWAS